MTFVLVAACGNALFAVPAFATSPGTLIKGTGEAVYYYAEDGKRYVFPTQRVFSSWYDDFSSVITVSDTELSSIPLGGNMTYRPGTRLVKVSTDPRVYAVDGVRLRWVVDERVARNLFGDQWADEVDDIPEAFFVNYDTGASIARASDYLPSSVREQTPTIRELLLQHAQSPTRSADMREAQLMVWPVPGLPENGRVFMGETHVPLFCFRLSAKGATFQVTPPLIHIEPFGDGSASTASLSGIVFEFPSLEDGSEVVYGRSKVSPLTSGGIALNTFRWQDPIRVSAGTERTLCVYSDIAAWSATPEDFFGKSFRVVMDAWQAADALVDDGTGTGVSLGIGHIVPSVAMAGDPFIVTSFSGSPPTER